MLDVNDGGFFVGGVGNGGYIDDDCIEFGCEFVYVVVFKVD